MGRQQLAIYLEQRCAGEGEHAEEALWKEIRRGWKFGAEDFVERIAEIMGKDDRKAQSGNHLSDAVRETEEAKARNMIEGHLEGLGTTLAEMRKWRKTHPEKTNLALKLRKNTTLGVSWIAKELNAGASSTLWKQMRLAKAKRQ